jgi:hypothetical protein
LGGAGQPIRGLYRSALSASGSAAIGKDPDSRVIDAASGRTGVWCAGSNRLICKGMQIIKYSFGVAVGTYLVPLTGLLFTTSWIASERAQILWNAGEQRQFSGAESTTWLPAVVIFTTLMLIGIGLLCSRRPGAPPTFAGALAAAGLFAAVNLYLVAAGWYAGIGFVVGFVLAISIIGFPLIAIVSPGVVGFIFGVIAAAAHPARSSIDPKLVVASCVAAAVVNLLTVQSNFSEKFTLQTEADLYPLFAGMIATASIIWFGAVGSQTTAPVESSLQKRVLLLVAVLAAVLVMVKIFATLTVATVRKDGKMMPEGVPFSGRMTEYFHGGRVTKRQTFSLGSWHLRSPATVKWFGFRSVNKRNELIHIELPQASVGPTSEDIHLTTFACADGSLKRCIDVAKELSGAQIRHPSWVAIDYSGWQRVNRMSTRRWSNSRVFDLSSPDVVVAIAQEHSSQGACRILATDVLAGDAWASGTILCGSDPAGHAAQLRRAVESYFVRAAATPFQH